MPDWLIKQQAKIIDNRFSKYPLTRVFRLLLIFYFFTMPLFAGAEVLINFGSSWGGSTALNSVNNEGVSYQNLQWQFELGFSAGKSTTTIDFWRLKMPFTLTNNGDISSQGQSFNTDNSALPTAGTAGALGKNAPGLQFGVVSLWRIYTVDLGFWGPMRAYLSPTGGVYYSFNKADLSMPLVDFNTISGSTVTNFADDEVARLDVVTNFAGAVLGFAIDWGKKLRSEWLIYYGQMFLFRNQFSRGYIVNSTNQNLAVDANSKLGSASQVKTSLQLSHSLTERISSHLFFEYQVISVSEYNPRNLSSATGEAGIAPFINSASTAFQAATGNKLSFREMGLRFGLSLKLF